jgi:hypothetical protein
LDGEAAALAPPLGKSHREGQEVVFRDLDVEATPNGRRQVFRFLDANYRAVVSAIVAQARAQSKQA